VNAGDSRHLHAAAQVRLVGTVRRNASVWHPAERPRRFLADERHQPLHARLDGGEHQVLRRERDLEIDLGELRPLIGAILVAEALDDLK
jgi:hypothetical protein